MLPHKHLSLGPPQSRHTCCKADYDMIVVMIVMAVVMILMIVMLKMMTMMLKMMMMLKIEDAQ